jgi:hypothetical protein
VATPRVPAPERPLPGFRSLLAEWQGQPIDNAGQLPADARLPHAPLLRVTLAR